MFFVIIILAVHFYQVISKIYKNRNNKCAICGVSFIGIEKFPFAASYQKFFYCKPCLDRIHKSDKYFFIVTALIVTFFILVYLLSR
jgi:hypothetical protein